ncbi:MAG: hypothetical protein LUF32_06520 [Clostridiales bacterium]|nr:hypothetical protein [Clostridiales bacterium]
MTKKKKTVCWIAVLIIVVCGIFIVPLKTENVTLQLQLEDMKNGQELTITLLNKDGDVLTENMHAYAETAELMLNPDFFACESITVSGLSETDTVSSIRLYSGSYDASRDRQIAEIEIRQQGTDGTLVLSGDICTEIEKATDNNRVLKGKLLLLALAVYFLALAYSLKRESKVVKYVRIFLWLFVGAYIVVGIAGDWFGLLDRYDTVSNVGESVQDVSINETAESPFSVTEDSLSGITVSFSANDETVYEDFGVRIIRTEDGEEIYSGLFTADYLKQNGEIQAFFADGLIPAGDYTLFLEPLDQTIENTISFRADANGTPEITSMYGPNYRNLIVLILCLIGILLLLLLAFNYSDIRLSEKTTVRLLYLGVLVYAVIQVIYYGKYVGNTPDEIAHISYIAYLLENKTLIPDFPNMPTYNLSDGVPVATEGTINYLGHPPLYYWILTAVQMIVGGDTIHLNLLRTVSAGMGFLGIAVFFGIGYRNISHKNPYIHLVYAAACISVPFITYEFCGINNDILSFLGVAVASWGILRFAKKNRNTITFLLLSCGMFLTVFSKLTAGLVLVIVYLVYFIYVCLKEKSIKCILNKSCLVVIPFILVIAAYFGILYLRYGTVQPTLASMDFTYYQKTGFYVKFSERSVMNIREYFNYYWSNFLLNWSDIRSHIAIYKPTAWYGWNRIIYLILLICPVCLIRRKKTDLDIFCLCTFGGMLITMLMQFFNAYHNIYFTAGYPGGFQSRYYLCWTPILALAFVQLFLKHETDESDSPASRQIRIRVRAMAVVSVLLLFYGSFIYTVLSYY